MSEAAESVNRVAIGSVLFLVLSLLLAWVIYSWSKPYEAPEMTFAQRVNVVEVLEEEAAPAEEAAAVAEEDSWGDEDDSWE